MNGKNLLKKTVIIKNYCTEKDGMTLLQNLIHGKENAFINQTGTIVDFLKLESKKLYYCVKFTTPTQRKFEDKILYGWFYKEQFCIRG